MRVDFKRLTTIAGAALSGASAFVSQRFGGMRMSHETQPTARPAGGLRLVEVPEDRMAQYLLGKPRDQRSFPRKNSGGLVVRPTLRYFTHVNYSRIYKAAKPGQRECRRRCQAFYVNPNWEFA